MRKPAASAPAPAVARAAAITSAAPRGTRVPLAAAEQNGGWPPSPSHRTRRTGLPTTRENHRAASSPSSPASPTQSQTCTRRRFSGFFTSSGTRNSPRSLSLVVPRSMASAEPGAGACRNTRHAFSGGGAIPSHREGSSTSLGNQGSTRARHGSTRCETKTLGLGFLLLFRRPAFSARASRASTTIHDRSKRRPVSVSAAFATEMPAQLFTGYTVRSTTVVEDIPRASWGRRSVVGEGKRPNKGRVAPDAPRDVRTKERARYLRWRPSAHSSHCRLNHSIFENISVQPTDKSKYLNAPDSPGAPRTHRA